ncbi:ATP-dependent translocase ABCB1-like isoform X1 [Lissotriton helveticus]
MKEDAVDINELAGFPINGYDNPSFQNDGNHAKHDEAEKSNTSDENDNIKKPAKNMVGFPELFRFADAFDIFLMIVGFICALISGTALPFRVIVFGYMINSFVEKSIINSSAEATSNCTECSVSPGIDLEAEMSKYASYLAAIAFIVFVSSFFQVWSFFLAATRQTVRIRRRLFYAILHQEMSWFDTAKTGTLNRRLTEDITTIRNGLGDKVSVFAQQLCTFVLGIVFGFVYGWKLTLVILSIVPLLAASAAVWLKILSSLAAKELSAYSKAGAIAEEILSAIRTVVAFNGQKKAVSRYEVTLWDARNAGMKKSFATLLSMGISEFILFSTYALGLWYGTKLTVDEPDNYSLGTIMTVFWTLLLGSLSIGQTVPNLENFVSSRVAAFEIYQIIKKKSLVDSSSTDGHKPDRLTGKIEFKNTLFSYPTRPDVQILNGLNLIVEPGKTTALVGASGCGKSTTIQLLQRFYDPLEGEITLDGQDIRTLNVKWLRENIGVVSQEPVLFSTTIAENIRYGRQDVTESEIQQAAMEANAYDFISNLPEKFNTVVGARGAQLSGGQKQRIAIARALARNPKILLLDEATSALDTQSEAVVQDALDKARAGRTTILIAHRLSTVKTADVIAGFDNGVIVEQGSHTDLMEKKGVYYSLAMQQGQNEDSKVEEEETTEYDSVYESDIFDESVSTMSASENGNRRKSSLSVRRRSSRHKSLKKKKKSTKKGNRDQQDNLPEVPFATVLGWSKPEWFYLIVCFIASVIAGCVWPAFGLLYGKLFGAYQDTDIRKRSEVTALLTLIFFVFGIISLFAYIIIGYTLGKSGENLTMRLRLLSFKALLRQEIGWFDDYRNAVGVWITRLSTDASQVKGAIGGRLFILTSTFCNLLAALIISFLNGWQLTLLILAFIPIMVGAFTIKTKSLAGHAANDQAALEEAGKISTEAVENIRTVASLTHEDVFYERYAASLQKPYRDALKAGPVNGLVYGLAQSLQYFLYAAIFTFGAWLIVHGYTDMEKMFIVFSCILFPAISIGQYSTLVPDYSKAKVAVQRIAKLLERQPQIDSYSEDGNVLDNFEGDIEFRNTKFAYPTRLKDQVLQGLNLRVRKGQTLALVGSSGCGKSTTIQLLERFYDPIEGHVFADRIDAKSLNLQWFRSQLGIVSQEPVLFDCSIAENIQYGDNSRTVSQEEIEEAAKAANIHSFIETLPEKYNTQAGARGTQLSGGQKQRIAIARALIRKPKVLLLDEATSALDTESEKIVQRALDDARLGRTCIVIAHRLSTVKNADVIAVIHHGQVVEQGTHSELLAKQGIYYDLVNAQVSH